jgi:hypothetical protein
MFLLQPEKFPSREVPSPNLDRETSIEEASGYRFQASGIFKT